MWSEPDLALLHEVEEAAGRGDQDVHAVREVLALLAVTDAAVDHGRAQVGVFGIFLERFLDLQRELAGGLEHEAADLAVGAEALENGQRKGRGLARAGLGRADHILAGEDHGYGLRLDRRRVLVAFLLDRVGDAVAEAERGK
jgi:hypothetical protein